jgi:PAS domain S-box-containing protein
VALTTETAIQDLIDAAPDALVVVDIAGAITLVNRRAEQLLGYTRDELLGQSFAVLVSDHNREVWLSLLVGSADALPERNPNPVLEVVARRKDGGDVPVEVSLNGLGITREWSGDRHGQLAAQIATHHARRSSARTRAPRDTAGGATCSAFRWMVGAPVSR